MRFYFDLNVWQYEYDVMTTCQAASRRIVLRYNAGGELADYVDHASRDEAELIAHEDLA